MPAYNKFTKYFKMSFSVVSRMIAITATVFLLSCTRQPSEPIYILLRGQSNAIGTTEMPVKYIYTPTSDVMAFDGTNWDVMEARKAPFYHRNKTVGNYSFVFSAAKKLSDHYDRPVKILVNAEPGISLHKWVVGAKPRWTMEQELIQRSGASNVIVFSHHGEAHKKETHEAFLKKMKKYEQQLLETDWYSGYIIHGELLQNGESSFQNSAIVTLPNVVSSSGLLDRGDNVHFNSESLHQFGLRYADKVIAMDIIK